MVKAGQQTCEMPGYRASAVTFAFMMILMGIAVPGISGGAAPLEMLEERLELRFDNANHAAISFSFSLFQYIVDSQTRSADDIRTIISGLSDPDLEISLQNDSIDDLRSLLSGVAPDDELSITRCYLDNSSLVDTPGSDANHPPVVLRITADLRTLPATYGLPNGTDMAALVPSALSDGMHLHRQMTLTATPGHHSILALETFPGSLFNETQDTKYNMSIDNTYGILDLKKGYGVTLLKTGTEYPWPELIRLRGTIDIPDFGNFSMSAGVEFVRVDPDPYWKPPQGIYNITTVSGRTLAELARAGLLSANDIYSAAIEPVQVEMEASLMRVLNTSFYFSHLWDLKDGMASRLSGNATNLSLIQMDMDLVMAILKAGGEYTLAIPMKTNLPTEMELRPPAGMKCIGMAKTGESGGRSTFKWTSPDGRQYIPMTIGMENAVKLDSEDVNVEMTADFNDFPLSLVQVIGSGKADIPIFVEVMMKVGAMSVPSVLESLLPVNLSLEYVTADLFRLLLDRQFIGEPELNLAANEIGLLLEGPLNGAFGKAVKPHVRYLPASLKGYDISKMDGSRPVTIQAWASGEKTKTIEWFKTIRASSGLARVSQSFRFSGIEGWNVTYKVRLAPELKITRIVEKGLHIIQGNEGGRDYIKAVFGKGGGGGNVTIYIEPTPAFLLSKLGPQVCPCSLVMLILIILVARRVIRKRRQRMAPEEAPDAVVERPRPVRHQHQTARKQNYIPPGQDSRSRGRG
jgi:hypothetical protein